MASCLLGNFLILRNHFIFRCIKNLLLAKNHTKCLWWRECASKMVIVLFLLFAWFCIHVLISLPNKLPFVTNVLLFMAIEVVLINKLTIIGFNLRLFEINMSIPHFLSLILHNDFTVTLLLLTYANVFLTTSKTSVRWGISVYAFFFQLAIGLALRWNGVLTDHGWNIVIESVMIVLVMAYTLLMGTLFQRMSSKEGWIR